MNWLLLGIKYLGVRSDNIYCVKSIGYCVSLIFPVYAHRITAQQKTHASIFMGLAV